MFTSGYVKVGNVPNVCLLIDTENYMNSKNNTIGVFILAKDEQKNIGRCLEKLRTAQWDVFVLDSGSTDDTKNIVSKFDFAKIIDYKYINHCIAYNEITVNLGNNYNYVMILDADMMVSKSLQVEISALIQMENGLEVLESEILMYSDGMPLKYGSLYPPKACVFQTGSAVFVSSGHAEKIKPGITIGRTKEKLHHDDQKSYASYIQSQLRYSKNLVMRTSKGEMSFRDAVRTKTPFLIFIVPFVSYIIKRGFMSGRAGGLYALDRVIAEAIMYRQSLSKKLGDM